MGAGFTTDGIKQLEEVVGGHVDSGSVVGASHGWSPVGVRSTVAWPAPSRTAGVHRSPRTPSSGCRR